MCASDTAANNDLKLEWLAVRSIAGGRLLGRISFFGENHDGLLDDVNTGTKRFGTKESGVRGVLAYHPSEGTRLRLTYYTIRRDDDAGTAAAPVALHALGPASPDSDVLYFSDIAGPTNNKVKTAGTGHFLLSTRLYGSMLHLDQDLGRYKVASITSYTNVKWVQDILNFQPILAVRRPRTASRSRAPRP